MTKMKRRIKVPDIRTVRSDRTIDMHGMTSMQAWRTLMDAVKSSAMDGGGTIKFITGIGNPKLGTGVIKNEFPIWLEHHEIAHLIKSKNYSSGVYIIKIRKQS